MTAPPRKLPRLPFVLLGLMTAFTFGGPLAIGYVLRGGTSPNWPPDRPVEWVTLAAISGMVFALMLACLSLALRNPKAMKLLSPADAEHSASPLPRGEGSAARGVASPVAREEGSPADRPTGLEPDPSPLPRGEGGRRDLDRTRVEP